jgi:hypothetical protein
METSGPIANLQDYNKPTHEAKDVTEILQKSIKNLASSKSLRSL